MKANVYTPEYQGKIVLTNKKSVFLAGTIEMGNSEDWQADAIHKLKNLDVAIFNPRRVLAPEDKEIANQISWELNSIDRCDFIFMFLAPFTISPISLYELGLLQGGKADNKKVILCCHPQYSRKTNIEVTINHLAYANPNIHLSYSFESSILKLKKLIND